MSIRARIAILTASLMIVLLLALSVGIHYWMARSLRTELDGRLAQVYETYRMNPDLIRIAPGVTIVTLADPDPFASPGLYIQAIAPTESGFVIRAQTSNLAQNSLPVTLEALTKNARLRATYYEDTVNGSPVRIYSAPIRSAEGQILAYVQVAESLKPLNETLRQLQTILIAGSALSIVIVTAAVWLVADAAVRPLANMTTTAKAIGGADDLSERLELPGTNDEVRQLAETFNAMLDRLEETFDAQRQFVADASHELRTPLTALRGNSDILLRMAENGAIDKAELIAGLTDISDEAERLGRLVQDLLTLARADIGWVPEMATIELAPPVSEAARNMIPLAGNRDFTTRINQQEPIFVYGGSDQLKQLVLILIDNAFTHTTDDASVTLSVRTDGDKALISVADDGPGIGGEHLEYIFDRFYRTDSARDRTSGGTGLGLAIARWIVDIHGGSIEADSSEGVGTTINVRLPTIPAPDSWKIRDIIMPATESPSTVPASRS